MVQEMKGKMANNYCVYKHTFPNGKVYIGQTKQVPERRWANGKGYQTELMQRAIAKYGWENIRHEIMADGLSHDEANELEVSLIAKYKSTDEKYGYNLNIGGHYSSLGRHQSKEHRSKIAQSHKKMVDCYSRDGTLKGVFESIMCAASFFDGSFRTISSCCNGNKKSAYGYVWRFHNDSFDKYETKNKVGGVKGFPVLLYLSNGTFVGRFQNQKEVAKFLSIREDKVGYALKGTYSIDGYVLKREARSSLENEEGENNG